MSSTALPGELEKLLADDVPYGDLTTGALGIGEQEGEIFFSARGRMVLAEVESAATLLELAGCTVSRAVKSGILLEPGSPILSARGTASALHRGWKVAQTLIEVWSGVATEARAIVDAATAVSPRIVVACTRKNMPGTKSFAVRAVRAGGAVMHRLGLSETVLVFPEHRIFLHGEPLAETIQRLRCAAPEKRLVIEAKSVDEAKAYAEAGFDVIQAEKFSTDQLVELVAQLTPMESRPVIAAAGGITANNAAAYARTGADVLVTSSPYLASPRDVAVRFALAAGSIRHTKSA